MLYVQGNSLGAQSQKVHTFDLPATKSSKLKAVSFCKQGTGRLRDDYYHNHLYDVVAFLSVVLKVGDLSTMRGAARKNLQRLDGLALCNGDLRSHGGRSGHRDSVRSALKTSTTMSTYSGFVDGRKSYTHDEVRLWSEGFDLPMTTSKLGSGQPVSTVELAKSKQLVKSLHMQSLISSWIGASAVYAEKKKSSTATPYKI